MRRKGSGGKRRDRAGHLGLDEGTRGHGREGLEHIWWAPAVAATLGGVQASRGSDNMAVLWTGSDSILEAVVTAPGAESGVTRQTREPHRVTAKENRVMSQADIANSALRKVASGTKAEMLGYVERVESDRALHCSLADIYYSLTFGGYTDILIILGRISDPGVF